MDDAVKKTIHQPLTQAVLTLAGLAAGFCLIAGNLYPTLDWLFYPGLLLGVTLFYPVRPSRWIAYAFFAPYFILVGLAVWLPVFPWYLGIVLALLLGELSGRVLYILLRQLKQSIWRFLVLPGFLFIFDFAFRQVPLLNRINLVPFLAAVYQQELVLVLTAVFGASLTVWILAGALAALSALTVHLLVKKQAQTTRSFVLPAITLLICSILIVTAHAWTVRALSAAVPKTVVRVAVVQGAYQSSLPVLSNDDLVRLHEHRLSHYLDLAGQVQADLYVFPETEFGIWDWQNKIDQHYRDAFQAAADQLKGMLLLCVTEGDSITKSKEDRYFSAVLLDSRQVYGLTAKRNLVPFSETSRYSAGTRYDVFTTPAGHFGVSICYDMQSQTVERLKLNGAELILAPFNDSGFKAVYHHVHRTEATLRAAECAIPIALANEDGISQLVDASGHIMHELGYREQGALVAVMPLADRYSPYLAIGRYLAAAAAAVQGILLLCLLGLNLVRVMRRRRPVT